MHQYAIARDEQLVLRRRRRCTDQVAPEHDTPLESLRAVHRRDRDDVLVLAVELRLALARFAPRADAPPCRGSRRRSRLPCRARSARACADSPSAAVLRGRAARDARDSRSRRAASRSAPRWTHDRASAPSRERRSIPRASSCLLARVTRALRRPSDGHAGRRLALSRSTSSDSSARPTNGLRRKPNSTRSSQGFRIASSAMRTSVTSRQRVESFVAQDVCRHVPRTQRGFVRLGGAPAAEQHGDVAPRHALFVVHARARAQPSALASMSRTSSALRIFAVRVGRDVTISTALCGGTSVRAAVIAAYGISKSCSSAAIGRRACRAACPSCDRRSRGSARRCGDSRAAERRACSSIRDR